MSIRRHIAVSQIRRMIKRLRPLEFLGALLVVTLFAVVVLAGLLGALSVWISIDLPIC